MHVDAVADLTELVNFATHRPAGATEFHVFDEVHRGPLATRVAEGVVDGVLDKVIGGADGPTQDVPRRRRFVWAGPGGVITQVASSVSNRGQQYVALLPLFRTHRTPVRFWYQDAGPVGGTMRNTGELFVPRMLPGQGKLASQAQIIDTAERFEVYIAKIDTPGLVGRKVMRRQPFEEHFHLVLDASQLHVTHHRRKDQSPVTIPIRDLIGIAEHLRRPLAITTAGAHSLPTVESWSKADYRGRDLAAWSYSRVLQRMAI